MSARTLRNELTAMREQLAPHAGDYCSCLAALHFVEDGMTCPKCGRPYARVFEEVVVDVDQAHAG
jgi:hypothetical protein